jgi:hypothetical protein
MKKRTKILIAVVLIITIIGSVAAGLNFHAFAKVNGDSGPLKWAISDDGVFTVNGVGYGNNYTNALTGDNACPWRSYRSQIKMVIVEEGVQAIGDYWFYNCSKITSVELPDSLVKIGANCFYGCSSLLNITVPENCCEYYNNTFQNCSALKWAVLPRDNNTSSYLHKIPDNTFYGCTALENVWVGEDYTDIGNSAFRNCNALNSIIWTGNSLSSIGSYYPSKVSIVGNNNIGSWCSSNSKSFINLAGSCGNSLNYSYDLNSKTLSLSGSGEMQDAPWDNWRYFIYDVDFGEASSLCRDAFYGCEYLPEELSIPASVNSIGEGAFEDAGSNCYIINAESISIEKSAFKTSKSLVFYGNRLSGAYAYVLSERETNPDWKYYCLGSHYYGQSTKCAYCDKMSNTPVLDTVGEHSYIYQYRDGMKLYYKCSHCEEESYSVLVRDLLLDFEGAISSEPTPYTQSNYDGRFDILRDGYINAKDFVLLSEIAQGKPTEYDMQLSNENATKQARALYSYIAQTYGNAVISGQQESTWVGGDDYEFNYIYKNTGKYPAIRGLDFMGDDFSGVVSRAKKWAKKGGIVSICWHCSSAFDQSYDACKADELTAEQWEAVLTEGTAENRAFIAGMDKAANALMQLQNEGIPVLWRPFHEFDGAWFWWGKGGSEYFKRLWIMMYNHYTYDLGLNNLIWVLGYCHNGTDYGVDLADWYPGNRYCDVVGADSYEVSQNGAEGRLFNPVYKVVGNAKPLAMHETGLIPTPRQFKTVPWVWFLTWHTTWLTEDNRTQRLNEIYNSDYVITLDELPNLYN